VSTNQKLKQSLSEVFGPDGWLVSQGRHHLPEQLGYANAVADWLTGEKDMPLALIEGETGTGKTLGYLFPLVLNWAFTKEKAIIATHTISLQNQLLQGDFKLVEQYLLEHNLPLPRLQQRLGKAHYVDLSRAEAVADLEPGHAERAAFLEWAYDSANHGSGLLAEWTEQYGPLPEGVTESNVCLTSWSSDLANPAYKRDKAGTAGADLIITSHMMVMLEAREYQSILSLHENNVRHLLFDEADQVPSVAEQLSTYRRQLREPARALRTLLGQGSSYLDTVIKKAVNKLKDHEQWVRDYGMKHGASEVIMDDPSAYDVPEDLAGVIKDIQVICKRTSKSIKKSHLGSEATHLKAHEVVEVLDSVAGFDQRQGGHGRIHALTWSPKLLIPSLMAQRANPAFFVSSLWRKMDLRVAFTSATLGVAQNQTTNSLMPFMAQLAISQNKVGVIEQFAPRDFGSVEYVLADGSLPKPIRSGSDEGHGESAYSETWLAYAARMIGQASASGPTLVLAGSYREAEKLGKKLAPHRPIVHSYGSPLAEAIEAFQAGQSQILISPAAWQGISIRNSDGSQLLNHLVVARLPFQPPNRTAEELAAILAERDQGRVTPTMARNHIRMAQINQTMIKLRQGFGRAIRQKDDRATIWICDPRFPRPGDKTLHKRFAAVIPQRFWESYQDAVVFSASGENRKARKEVPSVVEELLNL